MRTYGAQFYFNWQRVHGSINTTPINLFSQKKDMTPFAENVAALFIPEKEKQILGSLGPAIKLPY